MTVKKLLSVVVWLLCALHLGATTDSTAVAADSLPPLEGNWFQQLWKCNFRINDPRIRYPKFPNFCRKVYNWGNDTFNTYDTTYVVGTGKNWKIMLNSSNWLQSFGYLFDLTNGTDHIDRVILRSNINSDLGVSLNFMAVGLSHTWNVNQLVRHSSAPRSTWSFNFTCALFSAELQTLSTRGNAYIERFGQYNEGKRVHIPFDDVSQEMLAIQAYYFFNHRKYSQAAAYTFSKYQLKSAGTWLLGAKYSNQDIKMDFTGLDDDMLAVKPENLPVYSRFRFHEFGVVGGYAFNAVMPHHWLFNITATPSLGYRRSLMSGERKLSEMVVTGITGRFAFTYNHRALFLSLQGYGNSSFIFNAGYSFFSSRASLSLIVGARF